MFTKLSLMIQDCIFIQSKSDVTLLETSYNFTSLDGSTVFSSKTDKNERILNYTSNFPIQALIIYLLEYIDFGNQNKYQTFIEQ